MKPVLQIVAALLLSGPMTSPVTASTSGGPPVLEVGQPFPDIAFPSAADGTPMSIASFRGQKVVLHVFASW